MPLIDLNVPARDPSVPRDVRAFLREARQRIERFRRPSRIPGFVPSDFEGVYGVLRLLVAEGIAPGNLLCEWGSGFGVVTCLAAMLEFDACGIEIEPELVSAARRLATDFELPVQFACGSFLPNGDGCINAEEQFVWLNTDGSNPEDELGLATDDLDVIFVYPWPDEERLVAEVFERFAAVGALLVSYHGGEDFRLRRKIGGHSG